MTGFPWASGDALLAADLNAAIASQGQGGLYVTAFGATGDGVTDDTAAINAAIAAALATGQSADVLFPGGRFLISGTINVTTSGNQAVSLRGASSNGTFIIQTADADGIVMRANNVAGLARNGGMRVTGMALFMVGASTTRTALKLSSAAVSGQIGAPIIVDDVLFSSTDATHLWGTGLLVENVNPQAAYLSRVMSAYPASSGGLGTGIIIRGVSPNYTTNINLRDAMLINGQTGLVLGDFLQGITVQNVDVINTKVGLTIVPTIGGQVLEDIRITDSYIMGQVILGSAAFPRILSQLFMSGIYFDAINGSVAANTEHVSVIGVPSFTITNSIFNGPVTAVANVTGLSFKGGASTSLQIVSNTIFAAYLAGGKAISLDASTGDVLFVGNTLINNTTNITDLGTHNRFIATQDNLNMFLAGSESSHTGAAIVSGALVLSSLPTSSAGLVTGQVWRNGTVLNII
jgi:hypothetical protein